jgi:hypothetical protein
MCGIVVDSSIYPQMRSFTVPARSSGTIRSPARDNCGPTLGERDGEPLPYISLTERPVEDRLDLWEKIGD